MTSKGLQSFETEGAALLVASDADPSRFHLFDLALNAHVGTFAVEGVDETEGVSATSAALPGNLGTGMLVLADDLNDGAHTNYKLVAWSDVVTATRLVAGAGIDPTVVSAPQGVNLTADVETDPVDSYGDAADDPAIWIHPDDPALSVIIGAQKQRGVGCLRSGWKPVAVAERRAHQQRRPSLRVSA